MNPPSSALAEKYRSLTALRERREELAARGRLELSPSEATFRRAAFRTLAHEFPGCLRELDVLSARELAARGDAVVEEIERLRAGQPARHVWVGVVADFHATLRRALALKMWLARRVPRGGAVDEALVRAYRDEHGAPAGDPAADPVADAERLAIHLHPPGGRILTLVWKELSDRHGRPPADLVSDVFGAGSAASDNFATS